MKAAKSSQKSSEKHNLGQELKEVNNSLHRLEQSYDDLHLAIRTHTEQIEFLIRKNMQFKELVEANQHAVVTLESSKDIYADAYKANHDNIQEIRQRIIKLEVATQLRAKTDLVY